MEKRDVIVILAAIIVVLIMAVVVKPIITGQPVIFLPESPAPAEPMIEPYATPEQGYTTQPVTSMTTPAQAQEPTPSSPKPVSTVSPAIPVTPEMTPMTWQPNPDNPMPAIQMTNYAEIVGKYTGTTAPFRIPTPYWELHYNVTPADAQAAFSMDVIEKSEEGEKTIRTVIWKEGKIPDPREYRFFEGGKEYYLNIVANQLKEYRITIQIPLKYIRDT
ncbi:MAG TPA: hypothetical protein PK024_00950 [Methanospirillum sp.]|uniref:hypothetical protein n=1 Tax=Methanospirillum sp. TaxID=45200 RepID=UPI002CEF5301|nr:hypothetical protein [Methanospirillum sp.]HOJ95398.1 hypothetical protein [Methanospirillum sp.]HPP76705.1 hypothetical protein [Methanospirillum sp.]